MSAYKNGLLNLPRLQEIAAVADEVQDKCNELQDLLAQYEGAADLPEAERAEERASVRQAVADAMAEIVSDMRMFATLHERLEAEPLEAVS